GETAVTASRLPTDRNNIQIDFFGIGFRTGDAIRFQYKLEGTGEDWSAPSPQRTVHYASLAPGAYRFVVRAVGTDGIQGESPASVVFDILPPAWRRWWFIAAAAAAALSAVGVLSHLRNERMRSLTDSENRFRTLAETASDAILTID